jgi:nucleoid-associated protein YgaU
VAVLRAVGAAIALAVAVIALPWVLWQATAAIAPGGWDAAQHLLDRQDTGALALLAVCVIGWLAWGSFVLSLLVEIPAQLRGVRAPRLPGLQVSQRAATVLVGSLLVLLPAGTALASPAPAQAAPQSAGSVSAAAVPGPQHATRTATPDAAAPSATRTEAQDTYTVRDTRPAESLWSIAEDLYGHGEAYTRIAEANEGQVMVDESVFRTDGPIQPGWVLRLPAGVPRVSGGAAYAAPPAASAAGEGGGGAGMRVQTGGAPEDTDRVVVAGDTISEIAAEETGDGDNWPQVFEASRGHQPAGLPAIDDPDLIVPGQRVTIPAALQPGDGASQTPGEQRHDGGRHQDSNKDDESAAPDRGPDKPSAADRDDSDQAPSGHEKERPGDESDGRQEDGASDAGAGPAQTRAPESATPSAPQQDGTGSTASPSRAASAAPSASASPSPPAPAQSATSPAAQAPGAAPQAPASSPISAETGLQAFGLLAAVVTASLGARRLWQWRTRRPGQRVAASDPVPVEEVLEEAAHDGAEGIDRLHHALALLSSRQDAGPVLRAARISADSIQVLPDDVTADVLPPFTTVQAGWWTLPHTDELPAYDEGSATAEPAYASMVTLGAGPAGDLLLANLDAWQVLLVDGTADERAQVMAAMATELAIGPHADHVEVLTCGMGTMAAGLRTLGVTYLADPRIAAGEFAQRVLEAIQNPDEAGLPYVVLCAAEADEDIIWQLAEALERGHRHTPCVLVLPATAANVFPDAEILDAGTDEAQRVDAVGADVVLQRLDAATVTELADAVKQAQEPAEDAEDEWEHVPPEAVKVPGPAVRSVPAPPAPAPAPDQDKPEGDEDGAGGGMQGQAAGQPTPVVFQALMGATVDPSSTGLRPVPHATGEGQQASGQPIGPKYRIPVVHSLTKDERVPPVEETDSDRALSEAGPDDAAPRLRVLGALALDNTAGDVAPRLVELAAHLVLKPGSSADRLCEDLGDDEPWSPRTLSARFRDLRIALGEDGDGNPYVPKRSGKNALYALSDRVRCDWHEFERLAKLGLSRGADGLEYLERALALVEATPLGTHGASWMSGVRTRMQADITDVAHTVASYRTQDGPHQDLPSARNACRTGLTVDSYCEWLHRDLMRAEAAAGNHTGLRAAVATWREMTSSLPPGQADRETRALVDELLDAS